LKDNILYSETQRCTLFNVTFGIVMLYLLIVCFSVDNYDAISFAVLAGALVILIIPVLLFYRMKTTLTSSKLIISYGVGVVKKKFKTTDLDLSKREISNAPWYYGVGIRFAKDGILYNANPGKVLKIRLLNKERFIYVGTAKSGEFVESCKKIKQ
jgi:hypothetical protein